jgi:hypothetical protein
MKRSLMLVSVVVGFAGFTLAQQPPVKPAPPYDGVLGPQLIAWSELQKPQPVPQRPDPLPPPDTAPDGKSQPSPQDQKDQKKDQQPEPETQPSTASSITGTIVIMSGKYALETTDNVTYQLDDQDKAKQYDGKQVKVMGTLDRTTGIIHVRSIELLS